MILASSSGFNALSTGKLKEIIEILDKSKGK